MPVDAGNINRSAAEALRSAARQRRRHPHPGIVHCVIPCGSRALAPILREIVRSALREVVFPCGLKRVAGMVEAGGRSFVMNTPMRQRVEAAVPAPLIGVMRNAGALGDGADTPSP
jgi:hypothetical protein